MHAYIKSREFRTLDMDCCPREPHIILDEDGEQVYCTMIIIQNKVPLCEHTQILPGPALSACCHNRAN